MLCHGNVTPVYSVKDLSVISCISAKQMIIMKMTCKIIPRFCGASHTIMIPDIVGLLFLAPVLANHANEASDAFYFVK